MLAFTLTACGAASTASAGGQSAGTLSPISQLVVGTLKLDGTDQAITKEQAADLLPLWQVYRELMSSDTAAPAEIDGLTTQIRETMTAGQMKAIDAMKLTQADIFAFMREQGPGVASGAPGQSNRSRTGQGNSGGSSGNFPGGGAPGGGFPAGGPGGFPEGGFGGGGFAGGNGAPPQGTGTRTPNGTPVARSQNPNRVPAPLIQALIQYLQKVSAS